MKYVDIGKQEMQCKLVEVEQWGEDEIQEKKEAYKEITKIHIEKIKNEYM